MHECYAMQILETKKTKNKRTMVAKSIAMKHQDHVRRTQLDWAFCIQRFLDAPRAWSYYSHENDYQLQDWNKGLEPLPIHL